MEEFVVDFPGGARVDAHYGPFTIQTDQRGSAPPPFALFLASLGTCAGIYVLSFCQQRGLPTEGLHIVQRVERDAASHMVTNVRLDIHVPAGFPEKYKEALIRSAEQCAVAKHLEKPPKIDVSTILDAVAAP